ncbi:MAG: bifunctional phosphoglucose/phosphomannose isomerase [Thermoplasmatales archaeon]
MGDYLEEIIDKVKQMDFKDSIDFSLKFKNIVIFGMGGSGIAGKIFQDLFTKFPVISIDSYEFPQYIDENTLFISISYSGNTEETIRATDMAIKRGAKVWAITSGGELSKMVKNVILIPKGLQPRSSIGYLLNPLLLGSGLANDDSLKEAKENIEKLNREHEEMKIIADEIYYGNKIPAIFGFPPYKYVAYRLKTQFNENSKVLAYWSYFPELNHNDTMPLKSTYRKEQFYFIALTYPNINEIYLKRLKITSEICDFNYKEVRAMGESLASQIYTSIHQGDLISYYLAKRRGVDPRDVNIIEELKRRLS